MSLSRFKKTVENEKEVILMAQRFIEILKKDIENFLAEREKESRSASTHHPTIFNNERSLQLALCRYLENTRNYDEVIMEYYLPAELITERAQTYETDFPWQGDKMYVDIVARRGNEYVPLELKYITDSFVPAGYGDRDEVTNFLGSSYKEIEVLKRHSAQDIRCYDFWKDVKRLEFLKEVFPQVTGGLCLILTNEKSFLKGPSDTASYKNFGLRDGWLSPQVKSWTREIKTSEGRVGFVNKKDYAVEWKPVTLGYKAYKSYGANGEVEEEEIICDEKLQFYYYLLTVD